MRVGEFAKASGGTNGVRVKFRDRDSFLGHADGRSEDLGHCELARAELLDRSAPARGSSRYSNRVEVCKGCQSGRQGSSHRERSDDGRN